MGKWAIFRIILRRCNSRGASFFFLPPYSQRKPCASGESKKMNQPRSALPPGNSQHLHNWLTLDDAYWV
ncbi:hypothetical protein ACN38_g2453 [Penicillium nordicum]|uniref:Uncharacterized protein n=1 Tax=Penicillium nordicum TaxID=229535 RepID=A0A0N0RZN1_9EURO|nr:hypothetical protein ACN38_g2453 [Penicillium nordicum]